MNLNITERTHKSIHVLSPYLWSFWCLPLGLGFLMSGMHLTTESNHSTYAREIFVCFLNKIPFSYILKYFSLVSLFFSFLIFFDAEGYLRQVIFIKSMNGYKKLLKLTSNHELKFEHLWFPWLIFLFFGEYKIPPSFFYLGPSCAHIFFHGAFMCFHFFSWDLHVPFFFLFFSFVVTRPLENHMFFYCCNHGQYSSKYSSELIIWQDIILAISKFSLSDSLIYKVDGVKTLRM